MDKASDFGYMGFAFNYSSRHKDKVGSGGWMKGIDVTSTTIDNW